MDAVFGELIQVGGLLLGGVVIAATCAIEAEGGKKCLQENSSAVVEIYRNDCRLEPENNNSLVGRKIVLGPPIFNEYNTLARYFRKTGFDCAKDKWYLTIDLHPILPSKSTGFLGERKLYTELVGLGLVLVPGEVFGADRPGMFRISFSNLPTDDIIDEIIQRFEKLFYESGKERATIVLRLKLSKKSGSPDKLVSPLCIAKRKRDE